MLLIGYRKCSTCKDVERMLQDAEISYEYREIDKHNPTQDELRKWWQLSKLPLKRFFNTSGRIYRAKGLAQKLNELSYEEQLELLSQDGMLVKRPILIVNEKEIYVGEQVKQYLSEKA